MKQMKMIEKCQSNYSTQRQLYIIMHADTMKHFFNTFVILKKKMLILLIMNKYPCRETCLYVFC